MKAFTVCQPYAYAIVAGLKHFETRSWRTTIRGRVAVHAGKSSFLPMANTRAVDDKIVLPLGAVIGTVEIVDCVPVQDILHGLTKQERALGDYSPERWTWVLKNPIMFDDPIPARGKQVCGNDIVKEVAINNLSSIRAFSIDRAADQWAFAAGR